MALEEPKELNVLYEMMQSVLEQDRSPIVLCDLSHKIVYMNRVAIEHYRPFGGKALLGCSVLCCHSERSVKCIEDVVDWFARHRENNMICTYQNKRENKDVYMVALRDREGNLIGYYEKHEYRNAETAKTYDFSHSLV